jgi:hypothetical protein
MLKTCQANLLVVLLLVDPYKLWRGGPRQILQGTRAAHLGATPKAPLQPGRYDFLWFLSAPLAADRGGTTYHSYDSSPRLRCLEDSD